MPLCLSSHRASFVNSYSSVRVRPGAPAGLWCKSSTSRCERDGPGAIPGFLTSFYAPPVVGARNSSARERIIQRRHGGGTPIVGGSASFRPRLSLFVPLAEQLRQRSAKPRRRARLPHGTPVSPGISVERHTPVFQNGIEGALPSCPSACSERSLKGASARPSGLLREQEQAGALPRWPCANTSDHSRDAKPGGRQDFTGLVVAVQLRRRVAFGLQALQRCSGLLNRRAPGSTVAAHHFEQHNSASRKTHANEPTRPLQGFTTMNFDTIQQLGRWSAIRGCPGRFVLRGFPPSFGVAQLLGGGACALAYRSPKARDEVWIARLEDGGTISYSRPDGTWLHTLNTESGFLRKLAQLGIHLPGGAADLGHAVGDSPVQV